MKFKDIKITWDHRLVLIGTDDRDYELYTNPDIQGHLFVKEVERTYPPIKPSPWWKSLLP